jgi:hypothetical protein
VAPSAEAGLVYSDSTHCEGHCAMHDVKGILDFLGHDELRPAGGG